MLSPLLFNVYFNFFMTRLKKKWGQKGLMICFRKDGLLYEQRRKEDTDEFLLWGLLYADDLALFAENEQDLQEMLVDCDEEVQRFGMKMSYEKTEVMRVGGNGDGDMNVRVGGHKLSQVEKFKYCGGVISEDGSLHEEVSRRISLAGCSFRKLKKSVFSSKHLSVGVKVSVYNSCVLSVLLYGSETWAITMCLVRKLEVFHMNCLRCIVGKSRWDKVPNVVVRRMAGLRRVGGMLMKRRLQWLGHVARMSMERIPVRMMYGGCIGVRPRCGTRQRWKDVVSKDLKVLGMEKDWKTRMRDRAKWRKAVYEGVQKWNEREDAVEERKRAARAGIARSVHIVSSTTWPSTSGAHSRRRRVAIT